VLIFTAGVVLLAGIAAAIIATRAAAPRGEGGDAAGAARIPTRD
jgi:hypothetical protein